MNEDLKELKDSLNARLDAIDARFDAVDARFNAVDARFNAVDERFDAVDAQFDELRSKMGVLHEDLKADFRFSLEALGGLKEQVDRRFDEQARLFREELAPIRAAVKNRVGRE